MPKWYPVWRTVDAGNATIGSIRERFGFMGLRSVARQVRYGRYVINGIHPDANPRQNPSADIRVAERLEAMPPYTKIVQKVPPPNKDRWRSPENSSSGLHSTHGREQEMFVAQKKVRAHGMGSNRASASSESKTVLPPPAPEAIDLASPPGRVRTTIHRKIRDSKLIRQIKTLHRNKCQFKDCNHEIHLPDNSSYVEAHHLQPLGRDHNGYDRMDNILCVCPHHHAALDMAIMTLTRSQIDELPGHKIAKRFLDYHNTVVQKRWGNLLDK